LTNTALISINNNPVILKNNQQVKAKKHLGQHFLTDSNIAEKIADSLDYHASDKVLEIGPGMGVLTQFLLQRAKETYVIEIDIESVDYLKTHYASLANHIIAEDFLKFDLNRVFNGASFSIIGNFPYNISSQIVFKTLEMRHQIPQFAGMFQKEVALRICAKEGSKVYGILSVLTQAFYEAEYLFTVPPSVFNPPPKVDSGVLRLTRKTPFQLECDEALLFKVVKTAFNQRRKTLRNSLKSFNLSDNLKANTIFDQRPEQLSVSQFINLTQLLSNDT
jgi:16S rRNA (adenine1518-N6/adenine1519-N6)-dimethyltransferase